MRSCKKSKQTLADRIDMTLVFSPLGYGVIKGFNCATISRVVQGASHLYQKILKIKMMEWNNKSVGRMETNNNFTRDL